MTFEGSSGWLGRIGITGEGHRTLPLPLAWLVVRLPRRWGGHEWKRRHLGVRNGQDVREYTGARRAGPVRPNRRGAWIFGAERGRKNYNAPYPARAAARRWWQSPPSRRRPLARGHRAAQAPRLRPGRRVAVA